MRSDIFPSCGATRSDMLNIYLDLVVVSRLFFDQKDCGKQSQMMESWLFVEDYDVSCCEQLHSLNNYIWYCNTSNMMISVMLTMKLTYTVVVNRPFLVDML